jgi:hypothetical protein
MTKLISNTAFIGRYFIANNTSAEIAAQLNYLVTTYQPLFLRNIMGPKKASEFQAWLNITPADRPINATWSALLSGVLFVDNRGEDKQMGPITTPFTSYCYNIYQRGNVTQTTSSGEAMTLAQNAELGSPQQKLIDRWNEMVDYDSVIYDYLSVEFKTDADWLRWVRSFCGFSIWADDPKRLPNNELFEKINQFGL